MGDVRFDGALNKLRQSEDRLRALRSLTDDEAVFALAAASKSNDRFLANVLATEILNRQRRANAVIAGAIGGALAVMAARTALLLAVALAAPAWPPVAAWALSNLAFAIGALVAVAIFRRYRGDRDVPLVLAPHRWRAFRG